MCPRRLLLVFALRYEAAPVIRRLRLSRVSHDHWSRRNSEPAVDLVVTGGADSVEEQLPPVLAQFRPTLVISAGFSGALVENLPLGRVVVGGGDAEASAVAAAINAPIIRMTSHHRIVETPQECRSVHASTGAQAVDLEGGRVRRCCETSGAPFVSVRVISDSPKHPLPVPARVLWDERTGRPAPLKLLFHLVVRPWRWSPFTAALGRWETSRRSLADALDRWLSASHSAHP